MPLGKRHLAGRGDPLVPMPGRYQTVNHGGRRRGDEAGVERSRRESGGEGVGPDGTTTAAVVRRGGVPRRTTRAAGLGAVSKPPCGAGVPPAACRRDACTTRPEAAGLTDAEQVTGFGVAAGGVAVLAGRDAGQGGQLAPAEGRADEGELL